MNLSPANGDACAPAGAAPACLLINPLSCRMLYGGLARRVEQLAREHGLRIEITGDCARILELLHELRAEKATRLFVLSGDGTIQLIAGYLAELPVDDWSPELLLLGGGRANAVPRAFGGTPALPALRRVLQALREQRPLRVVSQPLLCVTEEGQAARFGFIMAGALIDYGVRYCRARRARANTWWHRGILADQISLLRLAMLALVGRSPVPPCPQLRVQMHPGGTLYAPVCALVVSALVNGGHYNPFARRGVGPLGISAVAVEAPRFWRNLPRMLTGRFNDRTMGLEQGYLSGRCHEATIRGLSAYSLDGEPHDIDPSRELRIATGRPLKVVHA